MLGYRLYCLDKQTGVLHSHEFKAINDEEAMRIAEKREHPHLDRELWGQGRKVASLPAHDVLSASRASRLAGASSEHPERHSSSKRQSE